MIKSISYQLAERAQQLQVNLFKTGLKANFRIFLTYRNNTRLLESRFTPFLSQNRKFNLDGYTSFRPFV